MQRSYLVDNNFNRRIYLIAFLVLLVFSSHAYAERGDFFIKLSPSVILFHEISIDDDKAAETKITKFLTKDYKKSRFFYSLNLGTGMYINKNVSTGIDVSYFPSRYSILYNNQNISSLVIFDALPNEIKAELKNSQNFVLNGSYSIFLFLNYNFQFLNQIRPFVGAKIGYVRGKLGIDRAFYDNQEKIAINNKLTSYTRNLNDEKLLIERIEFAPLALAAEVGCSFILSKNTLFDVTYEVQRLKFEDVIDNIVTTVPNPTLAKDGFKDYLLLHKFSLGLRFLL